MPVTSSILRVYKKRPKYSHKGDFGKVLVIGGSFRFTGAPQFNALAALRSGADMTILFSPERAANLAAKVHPDLITYPVKGRYLNKQHLSQALKEAKNVDSIVIGSGLGREKETALFVRQFLQKIDLPTVIDADALYALKRPIERKNIIYTPHEREFLDLFGKKPPQDLHERKRVVKKHAKGFTILLKGSTDIISNGRKTQTNTTGNPFMTKGGTGDILAGICGSLLARDIEPFTAACAGAYICGRAGDIAIKKNKESLLASDILNEIGIVIGR